MILSELSTDRQSTLKHIFQALEDKKAADIRVLDVSEVSSITDFLVLATGTSNPHLKALRGSVEATLKEKGIDVIGADTTQDSGWMVVDAFDVMIHVFTPEMRETYRLDTLWRDAVPVKTEGWSEIQAK